MNDTETLTEPDLQRDSDFCAGVRFGIAFALAMLRGVADETNEKRVSETLRHFADALEDETATPSFYAEATARWMEKAAEASL